MIVLLACHLAAAVALPWLYSRLGRGVLLLGGLPPAVTVAWAGWHSRAILAGHEVVETLAWAPALGFNLRVRVDAFALVMIALVSGIGVLIFAYSRWYVHDGPEVGRFAALLTGFSGAMLGLVVADNLIALYLFWELTSITSYLLIGFEDRSAVARAAALRALLITSAGGLAMLAGFVLLAESAGTYTLSELLAAAPDDPARELPLLLVLFGAFTKSAQAPFHFWLPGAMAAPTPVSAYLHSATMVKAGIYLVARLAPACADVGFWRPLVIGVGLATMLVGGWRALAQRDLKLLLAYGTVSQLGLLMVLFGAGLPAATLAGTVWILAHGVFKAALFMVTGIVDHQAGTRDLTRLNGLYRPLRATFIVAAISAASMAGLPPLAGYLAKETAFGAFAGAPGVWEWRLPLLIAAGSMLTFAYSARFLWGAFASKGPGDPGAGSVTRDVAAPPWPFLAPAAFLAVVTVAWGIVPSLWSRLVISGARALDRGAPAEPLALWHGFNEALALSALAIAGGALLWGLRRRVAAIQRRFQLPLDGVRLHDRAVALFLHLADVLTGRLQTGSLPMYLVVILSVAIAGPGVFLLTLVDAHPEVLLVDRPMQFVVVPLIIAAAVLAMRASCRMTAVVSAALAGYGTAFLFVIQGAPDLALTQLLVETMALVLFVLILRHLPALFTTHGAATWKTTRVLLATAAGVFTATAAMFAVAARTEAPVSGEYLKRALPEAGGHNVVNVILVDFRAFDTFGEILVLTVAVLGVIGLIRAAQRERGSKKRTPAARRPFRRSLILDGAVRILFHTVLLVSIVLVIAGHDRPGGGFIGGLVAGAAFTMVYLARGASRMRRAEWLSPELYLGSGITLAAGTGAAGWLFGGEFLEAMIFSADVPIAGSLKISSVLFFDLGVYLVVVGLITSLLQSAGREETLVS